MEAVDADADTASAQLAQAGTAAPASPASPVAPATPATPATPASSDARPNQARGTREHGRSARGRRRKAGHGHKHAHERGHDVADGPGADDEGGARARVARDAASAGEWHGSWVEDGSSPFFAADRMGLTPEVAEAAASARKERLRAERRAKARQEAQRNQSHAHARAKAKAMSSGRSAGPGFVSFPTLPRSHRRAMPDAEMDDEMRMARYYALRSGYSITSVINSPHDALPEPEPLVLYDAPGLSDAEIDLRALHEYNRRMGSVARVFYDSQRMHESGNLSVAQRMVGSGSASNLAAIASPLRASSSRGSLINFQHPEDRMAAALAGHGSPHLHPHAHALPRLSPEQALLESIQRAEREAEQELLACLEVVPQEYFQPDFVVSDPAHFGPLASRSGSQIVQEKLSHYLDLVEVNLLKQISVRSHSFFTALVTIQDLYGRVKQGCKGIRAIRSRILSAQEQLVGSTFKVLQKKRRLENAVKLVATMEKVSAVVNAQAHIKEMISAGNFSAALELITAARGLLMTELAGVKALKFVNAKLDHMTQLVEKMIIVEFVRVAVHGSFGGLGRDGANGHRQAGAGDDEGSDGGSRRRDSSRRHSLGASSSSAAARARKPRFPGPELIGQEEALLRQYVSNLSSIGKLALLVSEYRIALEQVVQERLGELVAWKLDELEVERLGRLGRSSGDDVGVNGDGSGDGDADARAVESERASVHKHAKRQQSSDSVLMDGLRQLSHAQFMTMLNAVFFGLVAVVDRVGAVVKLSRDAVKQHEKEVKRRQREEEPPEARDQQSLPRLSTVRGGGGASAASSSTQTSRMGRLAVSASASGGGGGGGGGSGGGFDQSAELQVLRKQFSRDLNELLSSTCDFTHNRCSRMIGVRADVHASLKLHELRDFFSGTLQFVTHTEKLCNKTFYGLRGTLLSQANVFLDRFHTDNMRRVSEMLDAETWQRVDVPRAYQILIDRGFESKQQLKRRVIGLVAPLRAASPASPRSPRSPRSPASPRSPRSPLLQNTTPIRIGGFLNWDQSPSLQATWSLAPYVAPIEAAGNCLSEGEGDAESENVDEAVGARVSADGDDGGDGDGGAAAQAGDVATATATGTASAATSAGKSEDNKASRVLFVEVVNPATGKKTGSFDKYPVVPTVLELLDMIALYVESMSQLQAAGTDILHKMVELLKVFNSRTCQLVLGAGAMHLAGLKSINAKHLALSAQCLGLVMSQIPVLRQALAAQLPEKHHIMLGELDRVVQDYTEHQREVFSKLVSIVRDLVHNTCKRLLKCSWAKAPTTPAEASVDGGSGSGSGAGAAAAAAGGGASVSSSSSSVGGPSVGDDKNGGRKSKSHKPKPDPLTKTLMKQVTSLHRVLSDLLPNDRRNSMFAEISQHVSALFCKYMSTINATKPSVQQEIAANIAHVLKRLRGLEGLGADACSDLEIFLFRD